MKKPLKTILWIIVILFAVPLLTGIIAVFTSGGGSTETTSQEQTVVRSQELRSEWKYETQTNEMDDSAIYHARLEADEALHFDFPYNGGANVYITLWHRGSENIAALRISKGQFMPSLLNGKIDVRFDGLPAQTYSYSDPNDGSSDIIFIDDADKFIINLKTAKRTIMQCTFFNEGTRIIRFNTGMLEWEH